MKPTELFLKKCKQYQKGTVKKRMSNNGLSFCLYSVNMKPVIYITPKQFETIIEHFEADYNTMSFTYKRNQ